MLAKLCVNPFDWSVPVLSGEGSQLPLCFGANGQSIMQENTSSHQPHSQHILPLKSTLFGGEIKSPVYFSCCCLRNVSIRATERTYISVTVKASRTQ